jgi:hypothetical protein
MLSLGECSIRNWAGTLVMLTEANYEGFQALGANAETATRLGHNSFLPNPSQFTSNQTRYSIDTESIVK